MGAGVAIAAPIVGGAIKRAGSWLAGRLFGSATKKVASTVVGAVGTGIVGAAAGSVVTRMTGSIGGGPPLPPTGSFAAPAGQGGVPRPREGVIGRTVSRILPGGLTGYEGVALEGTEYDKYGRPIAVGAEMRERAYAPPGYVIVQTADGPIAMLKGAARAMGLWHPKPKPPVSGWDMRAITKAHAAKKRVRKLGAKVGLKLGAKR
jgi:hypothetical protein